MENEKKRIYPAQQLVCLLPPTVLKTYLYLLGWQSQGTIKLYVKQIAKATKLTEDEVKLAIQTLEDIKLIGICKIDQTFCATLNAEQAQKYYTVPMSKVMELNGAKIATEVRWNVEQQPKKQDVTDLSEQEIRTMILRLQAQLNEKEQVKKVVVTAEPNDVLDLPF